MCGGGNMHPKVSDEVAHNMLDAFMNGNLGIYFQQCVCLHLCNLPF